MTPRPSFVPRLALPPFVPRLATRVPPLHACGRHKRRCRSHNRRRYWRRRRRSSHRGRARRRALACRDERQNGRNQNRFRECGHRSLPRRHDIAGSVLGYSTTFLTSFSSEARVLSRSVAPESILPARRHPLSRIAASCSSDGLARHGLLPIRNGQDGQVIATHRRTPLGCRRNNRGICGATHQAPTFADGPSPRARQVTCGGDRDRSCSRPGPVHSRRFWRVRTPRHRDRPSVCPTTALTAFAAAIGLRTCGNFITPTRSRHPFGSWKPHVESSI